MNTIKLVIFDIDGTLVDTSELFLSAYEYAMNAHNIKKKKRTELCEIIVRYKTVMESYQAMAPLKDYEKMVQTHHDFRTKNLHLVKAFKNTALVLTTLRKRKILVAALTNRVALVKEVLDYAKISHLLDYVISPEETGFHKPHPAGIIKILKHFKVKPENAIMVGDTEVDVVAGKAAGATTVGVLTGFVPSNVREAKPDFLIKDLKDLLDIRF